MADEQLILQENGYLPPGIHNVSIEEVERFFAQTIPDYSTRQELFFGYSRLCATIQYFQIKNFKQWIGGSFTTSKAKPDDIDVVTMVDADEINSLPDFIKNKLQSYESPFNRELAKKLFHCDSFLVIVPPKSDKIKYSDYQNARIYWRGTWGFDRQDTPRGFLELTYGRGVNNDR